jgi:site-specific DNA recombinase
MKVAIYARVSTEQQIENYSIPLQKERMLAYCKSRGWDDVIEYIDPGYSGSNIDRPAMNQLLKSLDNIDVVVVYKLDRLSRSQKDTLYLIEDCFLKNDVEFVSLSETIDTSTPFGRAMIGILSVFAQLERETITERLRSGRLKMTKELGYWSGGVDQNPTGYIREKRGKLVVNEEEAELVKRVYQEYITLQSITKIQKKFKKEGLPVWKFNRYYRVLQNRLYIGEVTFAEETYKGSHEPIIDIETFNKVQELIGKNRGSNYGRIKSNYLTGKIYCSHCGERYEAYSANNNLKNGTKVKYHYYICKRRRLPREFDSKCWNKTWKKEELEEHIFSMIEGLTTKNITKKSTPAIDYDKQIASIDSKLEKTLDLYLDGHIEKSKLDDKVEELNKEKSELLKRKVSNPNKFNKKVLDLVEQSINIRDASIDEKLTIINILIDRVYIDNQDIKVIWTF